MFQENTLQPKAGLSSICYKNSLFGVRYSIYRVTHIHGCCLSTSLEHRTDPCSSSVKWGTRFLHLTHGRLRLIGSDLRYQLTQGLYSQIGLAVSQRASRCQNHIFFWQNCYLPIQSSSLSGKKIKCPHRHSLLDSFLPPEKGRAVLWTSGFFHKL